MVTFKKIDPLFVLDLSDPKDPSVLGKLKIPGYSDYLHPYDKDHIIGIGKDTEEAQDPGRDFAWYQGLKMALFDVSDVENPKELHKVIIGDRGTDSPVLSNHKAFLFDRESGLLVIPALVAKIEDKERSDEWEYGKYIYQGAYVFSLDAKKGFSLRGKITHFDERDYEDEEYFNFWGDEAIQRSLYIEDVLYTLSNARIQANDLDSLGLIKKLELKARRVVDGSDVIY